MNYFICRELIWSRLTLSTLLTSQTSAGTIWRECSGIIHFVRQYVSPTISPYKKPGIVAQHSVHPLVVRKVIGSYLSFNPRHN